MRIAKKRTNTAVFCFVILLIVGVWPEGYSEMNKESWSYDVTT
jgi:hypothetical protein